MTDPTQAGNQSVTFLGNFSRKLIINTFFNFIGRFWNFAATIFLTPLMLFHLSKDDFGVWILFSIFLESYTLLDLGLGAAFVKYISAFYTHEDYERINRVLFSGLVFYLLHGVLLVALGMAARGYIFSFFDIHGAETAYLFALIASAVGNLGVMFLSVFRGAQRMDKSNGIEMAISIINAVGVVIVLQLGWGLTGLSINALFNAVVLGSISWWSVKRTMPWLSLTLHFDGALMREMFRYGAQILVSRVGSVVTFKLDKLIVARFLGLATVPFYEFSARLSAMTRSVPLLMMSALIPATSELGARNEKEKIVQTYLVASKYIALMAIGLAAFVAVEADAILRLWLGPGVEQSVILVQILVIGYAANVIGGPASQTGAGVGRPEFDMRSTLLMFLLTPLIGILLVRELGTPGVAIGTALSLIISAVYLLVVFHRYYLEFPFSTVLWGIHARPLLAGALAAFSVSLFHRAVPGVLEIAQTRYLIPLQLFLDSVAFGSVYVLFLVAVKHVTATDRRNFLGLMNFGFEFARHPFREWIKIYR